MNIFSYESKFTQTLMGIADLMILNVLYLLCCIPVFTIGAAQAGLYTGIRVLQDKEDDSSPAKAFFKGFADGFGRITLVWCIFAVVDVLFVWLLSVISGLQVQGSWAPVGIAVVALLIVLSFHALLPLFHSRIGCTPWQLVRNCWFLLFAHPIRCIVPIIATWLPMGFLALDSSGYFFIQFTPIWITLYFATAYMFAFKATNKPFRVLIDHYNEVNGIVPEELPEETEE